MTVTVGIMGYTDRLSYRPGEKATPCFSLEDDSDRYSIELIRLVAGEDGQSAEAFGQEPVSSVPVLQLAGRRQPIPAGSHVVVENCPPLSLGTGLTLAVLVYPTRPIRELEQCLISRRDSDGAGFELLLNVSGSPELRIASHGRSQGVFTSPLRLRRWYVIVASIDPASGQLEIRHRSLMADLNSSESAAGKVRWQGSLPALPSGPLSMAAALRRGPGGFVAERHFDGRLESPAILSGNQIDVAEAAICAGACHIARNPIPGLICVWDFSQSIDTPLVTAVGSAEACGRCVNHPTRAVTGAFWSGNSVDWRHRPHDYAAIHFHGDDLEDCHWSPDCSIALPNDLRSGIYALCAKSERGSRDLVPFFVLPKQGGAGRLAFLASTFTYVAYANSHHGYEDSLSEPAYGAMLALSPTDVFLNKRRDLGASLYDKHLDGSGNCIASARRPILNMRPDGKLWNFAADLHVIGFLERLGLPYDVVTDDALHAEGVDLLSPYRCLVTGTHPEYHTRATIDALRAWQRDGGRLFYAGGNGFYWKVATSPHHPHSIEVRRGETGTRCFELPAGERHHQFDGEFGGLWRANGVPPQSVVGVGFVAEGFDACSYYLRTPESVDPRASFIFAGVEQNERIGDFGVLGGAAGLELDATDAALGTPEHALVVARSTDHSNVYLVTPEMMISMHPYADAISNPLARAELTFFETPGGGAVFSTGSISWASSLGHNDFNNNVARISENVLRRFLDPTPFAMPTAQKASRQ